jgi:hypothetical protein
MNKQDRHFFAVLQRDLVMLATTGQWSQERFEQMQFRLSWVCPAEGCEEEHKCRGTFLECLSGLLVMAQLGFPSIMLEVESYAMEVDIAEADGAIADAEQKGTASPPMTIEQMLKTYGGKPGT